MSARDDELAGRVAIVPKGRWLTPDDHGRITVFPCSQTADPLCGLAIDVDGRTLLGWTPWDTYMAKRRPAGRSGGG